MIRIAAIAGLAASLACLALPASAKGEIPFEKAKGWTIERTAPDAKNQLCLMSKSYKDPDDSNAENGVIFILTRGQAGITLVYEKWTWDKDEKVTAPLKLDKRTVVAKSTWTGNGQTLTTLLPDTIVPNMLAAKTLVLKFEDGEADFDLSGFPEAYESLRRCDATPANVAATAPLPSEARFKAFYLGAMVESAMKECDVPTTGKQRSAFDEKMSMLRKEMGPAGAPVQQEIDKRPEPRCPPAEDVPSVVSSAQEFIDKSPEDFVAAWEKRSAEKAPAKSNL
jgi:hypothetical protein